METLICLLYRGETTRRGEYRRIEMSVFGLILSKTVLGKTALRAIKNSVAIAEEVVKELRL